MCKFSSKSGGVPFQILFFLGDLTRNDHIVHARNRIVTIVTNSTITVNVYRGMV